MLLRRQSPTKKSPCGESILAASKGVGDPHNNGSADPGPPCFGCCCLKVGILLTKTVDATLDWLALFSLFLGGVLRWLLLIVVFCWSSSMDLKEGFLLVKVKFFTGIYA